MSDPPLRIPAVIVALAVLAAACSSEAEPTTTTTTTVTTTTIATTTTVTTTTAAPTTTEPPRAIDASGEVAAGLLGEVATVYSLVADARNDQGSLPEGFADHLRGIEADIPDVVEVTAVTAALPTGDTVAVVHVADDLLFAVEDAAGWRVVGGRVSDTAPWLGDEPRTLLVLGSDARVGQNQLRYRADSIHLLTAVPAESVGAIVGFPRDSYVEGPEGSNKFAHHMAGAGPEVMLDIARELTALPIEGYVVTGFKGFAALIDILGSLVIDLPTRMRTGNNWKDFAAGLQTLNPTRALQLARIRKGLPGGDFARSFNQGLIMQAAMTQVQEMGIDMLPVLLVGLLENAWTDLTTDDLLTWAAIPYLMEPTEFTNVVLPGTVATIRGASVVLLDDEVEGIYRDLEDGVLDEPPA